MDIAPNQTIYVNNLYEKLGKEELKKCLYSMFSQFGRILDVVCLKTIRLRGQAWIVFTDAASATNALKSMQGFLFFDKPIKISYAKTKSDAVAKLDGSFKPDKQLRAQKNAAARETVIRKTHANRPVSAPGASGSAGASGLEPPNKVLFVQNLPEAAKSSMVSMLFQQFPGFLEVRMIETKPGIAFVDFETEENAAAALNGLHNFQITPSNVLHVSFAKR